MDTKHIAAEIIKMSYKERMQRLIQIYAKEEIDPFGLTYEEELEKVAIQALRKSNGEIDKVLASQKEREETTPSTRRKHEDNNSRKP